MSKTDKSTQKQKAKTSRLAILSILFGVLGLLASYFYKEIIVSPATARQLCIKIVCLMVVVGFFVSIAALLRIRKSKKIFRDGFVLFEYWYRVSGIVSPLNSIQDGVRH